MMCDVSDDVELMQAIRHVRYLRLGISSSLPCPLTEMDYYDSFLIDMVIEEQDIYEREVNDQWLHNLKKGAQNGR